MTRALKLINYYVFFSFLSFSFFTEDKKKNRADSYYTEIRPSLSGGRSKKGDGLKMCRGKQHFLVFSGKKVPGWVLEALDIP